MHGQVSPRHIIWWLATWTVVGVHAAIVLASLAGPLLIFLGTFYPEDSLSLAMWKNVFSSWERWSSLLTTTATVAATAVGVACVAGTAIACLLVKLDIRFRAVCIGLTLLAASMPLYVTKGAMVSVLGLDALKGSALAVGAIHALAHLPVVILVISVALRAVPAAAEESALVDGAGVWRTLTQVTLRGAWGGVVAAGLITLLWVTTDYSVSDILIVRTFAEEVYTQYALHGRPGEPFLVGLPQMVVLGMILWLLRDTFLTVDASPATIRTHHRFAVGAWRKRLSALALLAPIALVVVPVASVLTPLLRVSDAQRMASWFADEVSASLVLGGMAGVVTAALSVGLAWRVARPGRWRLPLAGYIVLMLAIPAPVLGIGLIQLLNRPGPAGWLYDSPLVLVLAYVIRFLPVATILMIPAVRAIPYEQELAARVDGATGLGVWLRIVWPQCLRMAAGVGLIVFVLSIGELPCSVLVAPPGCVTVGIRFFSLVHYGMYPDAAVLCLLSIGSVALPCGVLLVLVQRYGWRG